MPAFYIISSIELTSIYYLDLIENKCLFPL